MDRVTKFAKANLKNKKDFGEDARLAFKRHINDLARSEKNDPNFPYRFDEEKAELYWKLYDKIKEILSKAHKKYNTYFYPTIRALENFGYSMQRKKIGGHFMYVVKLDTID